MFHLALAGKGEGGPSHQGDHQRRARQHLGGRPYGPAVRFFLGPEWRYRIDEPEFLERVLDIPDEELWSARLAMRNDLFNFIRTVRGDAGPPNV